MTIDLAGRTAIVTGAAHGLGRAITVAMAAAGADLFACDVLDMELADTVAQAGPNCRSRKLDVTDPAAIRTMVTEILRGGSSVDILINNAGGVLGQVGRPLETIGLKDWQSIFDVNLTGVFLMSQAVAPGMKARQWGRIVNISSGAGLGISLTGIQAYASAKAGQIGLTRQLAHELGPFGITVNAVAPGFVRSNPTTERQWDALGPEGQDRLVAGIALRRLGNPEDIAAAVMFFASEKAGWISGQVLSVDGGK